MQPMEYVLKRDPNDWVLKYVDYGLDEKAPSLEDVPKRLGMIQWRMTWNYARGRKRDDAVDRERWREGVHGCKWPIPA